MAQKQFAANISESNQIGIDLLHPPMLGPHRYLFTGLKPRSFPRTAHVESGGPTRIPEDPLKSRSPVEAEMLKTDFASQGIRLETLRECLVLYQRIHGCDLTSAESSNGSEKEHAASSCPIKVGELHLHYEGSDRANTAAYPPNETDSRTNQRANRAVQKQDHAKGQAG